MKVQGPFLADHSASGRLNYSSHIDSLRGCSCWTYRLQGAWPCLCPGSAVTVLCCLSPLEAGVWGLHRQTGIYNSQNMIAVIEKLPCLAQVVNMRRLLLFCICLATCFGYRENDWIDPTDMLNYDASAGRMRDQKEHPSRNNPVNEHSEEQGTCQTDNLDCKSSTENWKQKDHSEDISKNEANENGAFQKCSEDLESLKQEMEKSRKEKGIHPSSCNPVFRRYLHRILKEVHHLGLPGESQPEIHYDAEIKLTKEMVAEMQRFLSDAEWNVGALDEVLTRTLIRFKYHNIEEWQWKLEDYIGIDPFTAFMISLSVLCIIMTVATELWTHISWFTQMRRLFIVLFFISIGWNWMYLYKVAFAERQAEFTKMQKYDAACGKKVTWSESLLDWWRSSTVFQNDPCEEYFKALMINPILLVPPTKALAVTFTNLVTEPLKHVGKGIGEFFRALLSEMPVFYQLPVLIVIALLLLVFCYGAGTSIHHIGLFRRNDAYRERLPPPDTRSPAYNQYIEAGDQRSYHGLPSNQPCYIEGPRGPSNLRPENLHDMDRGDFRNQPQEEHRQIKQMDLENRTTGQNELNAAPIMARPLVQEQSKEVPVDNWSLSHQPVKDFSVKGSPESQVQHKESSKAKEHVDKSTPVQRNIVGSSPQLLSVEAVENTDPSSAEAKEETGSCTADFRNKNGKEEQIKPQTTSEDYTGSSTASMHTSAVRYSTQGVGKDFPIESLQPNGKLAVEDLYTDRGIEGQYESFLVLENQD